MDINKVLEHAANLKIAVIGDLIIDQYVFGGVDRISPEAPVPIVNQTSKTVSMGGAGNVFMNLHNLGVDVDLFCNFNGKPIWPEDLSPKIFCNPYPAPVKTRIMSEHHHILRIDQEISQDQIEWPAFKQISWWEYLQENLGKYDRIVISDYHKGCVSDSLINAVMELTPKYHIPVYVDAKKDFGRFHGAFLLKCNKKEAPVGIHKILLSKMSVMYWMVTCGESGISYYTPLNDYGDGVDGVYVEAPDVCGAGDTAMAIFAIMEESPILRDWVELAVEASAEVCRHRGVYPITKEDLLKIKT
jgi:bifunctional ADP-heptose synthase (sugar kinase/adenylyltransferase)